MNKELKLFHKQIQEILDKIDIADNFAQTVFDALSYCDENNKECCHVLTVMEYLKNHIKNIGDMADEFSQNILMVQLSMKNSI